MATIIETIIATPETCGSSTAPGFEMAEEMGCSLPLPFFIHREDSEPDSVALRSRLAPTQPYSSLTFTEHRPTDNQIVRPFRSGAVSVRLHLDCLTSGSVPAGCCRRLSLGKIIRVHQGGLRVDGFQRTINLDLNQRGVREYLI